MSMFFYSITRAPDQRDQAYYNPVFNTGLFCCTSGNLSLTDLLSSVNVSKTSIVLCWFLWLLLARCTFRPHPLLPAVRPQVGGGLPRLLLHLHPVLLAVNPGGHLGGLGVPPLLGRLTLVVRLRLLAFPLAGQHFGLLVDSVVEPHWAGLKQRQVFNIMLN